MKTNVFNRASIFTYAWRLVKNLGLTLKEALTTAWANAKFYARSHSEVLHFIFKKKDGSLREAFGTLRADIIPQTNGNSTAPSTNQVYFDVEVNDWRSFIKSNLVRVL